jgi:thiol-disulfide isomerase/thioredoxin
VLRGGRKGTLRTLRTTVPVLVVFYNPDCESCVETLGQMRASQVLTQAVQSGRLTVLAVYTEGDADIWRQHAGELPDGWLDAQDPARVILEKELYDLSGMPSLYLLDKDKRVMLKDPTWPQVEAALQGAE